MSCIGSSSRAEISNVKDKRIKETKKKRLVRGYLKNNAALMAELNIEKTMSEFGDLYDNNIEKLINSTSGVYKNAIWNCKEGHEWTATIFSRTSGVECPFCAGRFLIVGVNDLETVNPKLAKEWHPTLNGDLEPSMFKAISSDVVWWQCKKGHEWQSSIGSRNNGIGCLACYLEKRTSVPEKAIYYYIKKYVSESLPNYRNRRILNGLELDIYIPTLKLAIEYDGHYHTIEKDLHKNEICEKNGIRLIRIREIVLLKRVLNSTSKDYQRKDTTWGDLEKIIKQILLEDLKILDFDIDIVRDLTKIYELMEMQEKENSLATKNPELSKEWHPTKNGLIIPSMVSPNSGKTVWWLCENGHKWQDDIVSRNKGRKCSYCSGRKLLPGFNDLETKNPKLAKEWHPTLNGDLKPSAILINYSEKVWWQCSCCKHEWLDTIKDRNDGKECPICKKTNNTTIKKKNGFSTEKNNLTATNPKLAKEWNVRKNKALKPYMISRNSEEKVWWKCKNCKHEWEQSIRSRAHAKKIKCPNCGIH